jgi:hypothetical protein
MTQGNLTNLQNKYRNARSQAGSGGHFRSWSLEQK